MGRFAIYMAHRGFLRAGWGGVDEIIRSGDASSPAWFVYRDDALEGLLAELPDYAQANCAGFAAIPATDLCHKPDQGCRKVRAGLDPAPASGEN